MERRGLRLGWINRKGTGCKIMDMFLVFWYVFIVSLFSS